MLADTKTRYGAITRLLHWVMALGFLWMLFTATVHFINQDSALTDAVWRYHGLMGFTLFMLGGIRVVWLLIQHTRRPENDFKVRLGHWALYVLMIVTPFLAFMRAYGSGRGFSYFGWQIFAPRDSKVGFWVDLANQWHGVLGWVLFLFIMGHIIMAFYHRSKGPEHNVLPRIIGRSSSR